MKCKLCEKSVRHTSIASKAIQVCDGCKTMLFNLNFRGFPFFRSNRNNNDKKYA